MEWKWLPFGQPKPLEFTCLCLAHNVVEHRAVTATWRGPHDSRRKQGKAGTVNDYCSCGGDRQPWPHLSRGDSTSPGRGRASGTPPAQSGQPVRDWETPQPASRTQHPNETKEKRNSFVPFDKNCSLTENHIPSHFVTVTELQTFLHKDSESSGQKDQTNHFKLTWSSWLFISWWPSEITVKCTLPSIWLSGLPGSLLK